MNKLNKKQLLDIKGGSVTVSASLINAVARAGGILLDLGRSVGTAIRRITTGKTCSIK